MKFKVGDKVRVKSKEELEKCNASIRAMPEICGDTVTIYKAVDCIHPYYLISEDYIGFEWTEEMFEDEVVNDDQQDTLEYAMKNQVLIPLPKITKIMLIEDGSIDLQKFEQELLDMGIQPIVYRQGANPPKIIDLESKNEKENN